MVYVAGFRALGLGLELAVSGDQVPCTMAGVIRKEACFFAEPVSLSAYVGSSKKLKDLKDHVPPEMDLIALVVWSLRCLLQ